jgi:predicted PurR-regulated permease PerM
MAEELPKSELPPRQPPARWSARHFVLAALTTLVLYLCYRMTLPVLPALTWAMALAILTQPLYRWLAWHIHSPNLAALLGVTVVALLLLVPAGFVGAQLVQETSSAAQQFQDATAQEGSLRTWLAGNRMTAPLLRWSDAHLNLQAEVRQLTGSLADAVKSVVSGSLAIVVQLLIMLFALFYLFRDRDAFLAMLRSLSPLSDAKTARLFQRIQETVEATLYGRLMVAALQGALGGLMFWWLGLPAPVLWGTVMAVLAVIPWLGAFVIWVPVALFLLMQGDWGKALILTAWGALVIGLVDNLLYPLLVGDKLRLHALIIFIALIGGLALFGAAGIVIGPVIVSVADGLLNQWRRPPVENPEKAGSV